MTANNIDRSNSLVDLAHRINTEHEAAEKAYQRGVEHAFQCGALLCEAKEQIPHGQWIPWLQAHCSVSSRTARLYMQLARSRPELESKTATVANLTLRDALNSMQRAVQHIEREDQRSSYTLETPQAILPSPTGRTIRVARNPAKKQWMLVIGPGVSRATVKEKEKLARESAAVQQLEHKRDDLLARAAELEAEAKTLRESANIVRSEIADEIKKTVGPVSPFTETYDFQCNAATDKKLAKLSQKQLVD